MISDALAARAFKRAVKAGNAANRERRWTEAMTAFEAALAAQPKARKAWIQLGHARKEIGLLGKAEEAYRRAVALDGTDADAHLQLGHALKLQGRIDDAIAAYEMACAVGGESRAAWHAREELEALAIARRPPQPPKAPARPRPANRSWHRPWTPSSFRRRRGGGRPVAGRSGARPECTCGRDDRAECRPCRGRGFCDVHRPCRSAVDSRPVRGRPAQSPALRRALAGAPCRPLADRAAHAETALCGGRGGAAAAARCPAGGRHQRQRAGAAARRCCARGRPDTGRGAARQPLSAAAVRAARRGRPHPCQRSARLSLALPRRRARGRSRPVRRQRPRPRGSAPCRRPAGRRDPRS
ncbi:tetratricopeptide repeat protein [Methylobrevis pamukkalensis]